MPSKKPAPAKRVQLERRLNKKLGELSGQRSRKDPKKDGASS